MAQVQQFSISNIYIWNGTTWEPWDGVVTGGSGGTQYVEDAAAAANPTGTVPLLIRKDTPSATVSADGDNIAQRGSDFGAAYVTLLDTSGNPVAVGGGTQYTEDAAAAANPVGTAVILVRADTPAGVASADGDNLAQRGSNFGASYVTILDAAGAVVQAEDLVAQELDYDTGAGTATQVLFGIALPASGGPVAGGTATNPVQIGDAGGSLTVDGTVGVSGTVAVTQSGTWDEVGINDSGNSITIDNAALSVVGGGVEATALRVTVASDSTGVLSVDDNGGSLTVDGTVAVTNAGLTALDGAIAGTEVQVDIVSSALPTGAATSAKQDTQITAEQAIQTAVELLDNAVRAEDEASAGGHSGFVVLARRTDTPAAQSGTDGDYEFLQVVGGRLAATSVVTGTVTVDGSGVTQPVSHAALTELAAAIDTELQVDIVGALPAGTNAIGKLAANSGVDIGDVDILSIAAGDNNIGNVDVLSVITGTGATNLGKAEDGAHTSGDVGVMLLGVRNDNGSATGRGSADDDYVPISVDNYGAVPIVGHPNSWTYHENSSSALTDTQVAATPGAGLSLYVTDITVSTGAATAYNFFLEEGSTTVYGPMYLEAVAGRGFTHVFKTPKKITANTALTITTSAAIAHAIDIQGFIAP